MGKISYRPKKNHSKHKEDTKNNVTLLPEEGSQEIITEKVPTMAREEDIELLLQQGQTTTSQKIEVTTFTEADYTGKDRVHIGKMDNLKVVGDMECEYHVYLEDYVYTYMYQYAFSDLSKENSAILIGEVFLNSKEAIIRGIIPIDLGKIEDGSEWISTDLIEEIEEQRKLYFEDQEIIGWMHMQPGYGTMLTMKELREHRNVFEGAGSLFMLVDAINKIESVYIYEEEELKEQSGYCMYYERNEQMQKYMLDHPFAKNETEEIKDNVVNQFREIGKMRKEEYAQRKGVSVTVGMAAIVLVALAAIIVKMNDDKLLNPSIAVMAEQSPTPVEENGINVIVKNNQEGLEGDLPIDIDGQAQDTLQVEGGLSVNLENEVVSSKSDTDNNLVSQAETTNKEEMDTKQVNSKTESIVKEGSTSTDKADTASTTETKSDVTYEEYVVQPGDTLANISYSIYGDAKKSLDIAEVNGLESTNEIYVGQKLKLPK